MGAKTTRKLKMSNDLVGTSKTMTRSAAVERRIMKELEELGQQDEDDYIITFDLPTEDIYVIVVTILGPKGSPYEGGHFKFKFELPSEYPFRPPRVTLLTKCYHPGVTKSGNDPGCLDLTKDAWSPAITVKKMCRSYYSLLKDPNPDDPLVPEIADLYKRDYKEFCFRAREMTLQYAMPDP
eukprot:GFYU01002831.1.p1 GENE.GFYU01002831.1~~GFYU01002831.1.p1  ORF type:complete len:181 (-),score=25.44 GFYU01002831.1:288-830(-)